MQGNRRRRLLATGDSITSGAMIGCAAPVTAADASRTPFAVPATTIPIAGTDPGSGS